MAATYSFLSRNFRSRTPLVTGLEKKSFAAVFIPKEKDLHFSYCTIRFTARRRRRLLTSRRMCRGGPVTGVLSVRSSKEGEAKKRKLGGGGKAKDKGRGDKPRKKSR